MAAVITIASHSATAHADERRILLLLPDERQAALAEAFRIERLPQGERIEVAAAPPDGSVGRQDDHARDEAHRVGAELAIYLERSAGPLRPPAVRAVFGDGTVRQARLRRALDAVEPRVFALVAASLVEDEPDIASAPSDPVPPPPPVESPSDEPRRPLALGEPEVIVPPTGTEAEEEPPGRAVVRGAVALGVLKGQFDLPGFAASVGAGLRVVSPLRFDVDVAVNLPLPGEDTGGGGIASLGPTFELGRWQVGARATAGAFDDGTQYGGGLVLGLTLPPIFLLRASLDVLAPRGDRNVVVAPFLGVGVEVSR